MKLAVDAVPSKEVGYKVTSKQNRVPVSTLKDYIKKTGDKSAEDLIELRIGRIQFSQLN